MVTARVGDGLLIHPARRCTTPAPVAQTTQRHELVLPRLARGVTWAGPLRELLQRRCLRCDRVIEPGQGVVIISNGPRIVSVEHRTCPAH